jgi:ribosome-binding ATPase YchF (GTP1/OBG family)
VKAEAAYYGSKTSNMDEFVLYVVQLERIVGEWTFVGGYAGAREKGQLRLEGKEYIVKDGDVLVIRHG